MGAWVGAWVGAWGCGVAVEASGGGRSGSNSGPRPPEPPRGESAPWIWPCPKCCGHGFEAKRPSWPPGAVEARTTRTRTTESATAVVVGWVAPMAAIAGAIATTRILDTARGGGHREESREGTREGGGEEGWGAPRAAATVGTKRGKGRGAVGRSRRRPLGERRAVAEGEAARPAPRGGWEGKRAPATCHRPSPKAARRRRGHSQLRRRNAPRRAAIQIATRRGA